jgi:cell division protein FtsL
MNLDVEYAIKKDIRNNPVVREVDLDHKRQLMRTIVIAIVVVAMLLFWVWQRFGIVETGYQESALQAQLAFETARNRQLQLEVEMLRAPQLIETLATRDLHMVAPTPDTTLVIEHPGTPRAEVVR